MLQSGGFKTTKFKLWSLLMLAHTKKHPTESIRLVGSPEVINRLRKYALKVGAGIIEVADCIPASDISPELDTNPGGVYLRGIRLREGMTQDELANLTGISRSNISAMEHGKRPIGKETAKKLAAVLRCDYRRFL
jgi:DNA-binding XRE family transcriptional regulator